MINHASNCAQSRSSFAGPNMMHLRIHTGMWPRKSSCAWRWDISLTSTVVIWCFRLCAKSSLPLSISNWLPTTASKEVPYPKLKRTPALRSWCPPDVTSFRTLASQKAPDRGPIQVWHFFGKRSSKTLLKEYLKTSTIRVQKFFLWWASTLMIRLMPCGGKRMKSWRITRRRLRGQNGLQTSRRRVWWTSREIEDKHRKTEV